MIKETIFDYDITPQELKFLYIKYNTKEIYLEKTSPKKILHDLYVLFRMREDYIRAGTIRKKLFGNVA
jgi:hypothetical protein